MPTTPDRLWSGTTKRIPDRDRLPAISRISSKADEPPKARGDLEKHLEHYPSLCQTDSTPLVLPFYQNLLFKVALSSNSDSPSWDIPASEISVYCNVLQVYPTHGFKSLQNSGWDHLLCLASLMLTHADIRIISDVPAGSHFHILLKIWIDCACRFILTASTCSVSFGVCVAVIGRVFLF